MVTVITGAIALIFFLCLVVYVAVAAGLRPKFLHKKTNAMVITLLALLSAAGLSGYLISSHLLSEGRSDLYLAIQSLRQDQFEDAHDKLISAVAQDGETFETNAINAMLYLKQRDYASAKEYIGKLEENPNLTQTQTQLLERLRVLAPAYVTDSQASGDEYESLCSALVQFLNLSVATKTRCDKFYDIEHAVQILENTGMQDASVDISEMIGDFKARYPGNLDIEYLKIRYHVVNNNYAYAVQSVQSLLEEQDTLYHRVLYSDILLQDLYAGSGNFFPAQSAQAAKYQQRAQDAQEEITQLQGELSGELSDRQREKTLEKIRKLQDESQENLEKAQMVPINQILNYVHAKQGLLGDKTGTCDLLEAKAYYSAGDLAAAEETLTRLIQRVHSLSDNSPVRIALQEATDLAQQYDGGNPTLTARYQDTVRLLVKKGGCVAPVTGDYLNANFTAYLTSFLLEYARSTAQ